MGKRIVTFQVTDEQFALLQERAGRTSLSQYFREQLALEDKTRPKTPQ